ncbi:MAG: SMI1/KNR4 family protein, partial [candidate division WOR-3 bacterium]
RALESPVVAKALQLSSPGIGEEGCQRIERVLGIKLPLSYRRVVKNYDLSNLEMNMLSFGPGSLGYEFDMVEWLIKNNSPEMPLSELYAQEGLLEVATLETAPICIRTTGERSGEVVWFDPEHEPPPYKIQFAASDFESLIIGTAIVEKMERDSDFRKWASEHWRDANYWQQANELAEQVVAAIAEVDPRAWEAKEFWYSLVG